MSRMSNNSKQGVRRLRKWVLGVALGVCAASAAPVPQVMAGELDRNRVQSQKLPDAVRQTMNRETSGSSDIAYYRDEANGWFVQYTLPSGLRVESKVKKDGTVAKTRRTAKQPKLREAEAKREFRRLKDAHWGKNDGRVWDELTEALEEARQDLEEERAKLAGERQQFEADRRRAQEYWRDAQRRREEEAQRDRARRLDGRDYDDHFGSRRYGRAYLDDMPSDARRAIRDQTRDAEDVEYYRFTKNGRDYYGAQFTTSAGRRLEVTTDEDGRTTDRVVVSDYAGARRDVRDRDFEYDRGRGWDRDRSRLTRERLPRDVREALDDQTYGATDVDYYRLTEDGRTLYAARYTTSGGRRIEARADESGRLANRVELYDPSDSRGFNGDNRGYTGTGGTDSRGDALRFDTRERRY